MIWLVNRVTQQANLFATMGEREVDNNIIVTASNFSLSTEKVGITSCNIISTYYVITVLAPNWNYLLQEGIHYIPYVFMQWNFHMTNFCVEKFS